MMSQIFEFLKLWNLLVYLKRADEKCLLAKNQHLIAILGQDINGANISPPNGNKMLIFGK